MGAERRRHERWKLEEDLYCYIDGQRLDAESADISAGGMFFKTDRPLVAGKEVALVFQTQLERGSRPIFLVGRVMRRQIRPVVGVGIRWERAATPGTREELTGFLERFLKVRSPEVRLGENERGIAQAVFEFPLGDAFGDVAGASRSEPGEFAPMLGGEEVGRDAGGDEDTLEEPVVVGEPGDGEGDGRMPQGRRCGPLTDLMVRGEAQAPADLDALLDVGKDTVPVKVVSLGVEGLLVQCRRIAFEGGKEVLLRFTIPKRSGEAVIACRCEVGSPATHMVNGKRGLVLRILSVEEGGDRGILKQYVRWLHFNACGELDRGMEDCGGWGPLRRR